MIVSFKDHGTRDVFEGNDTRGARQTCPQNLWPVASRKLQQSIALGQRAMHEQRRRLEALLDQPLEP